MKGNSSRQTKKSRISTTSQNHPAQAANSGQRTSGSKRQKKKRVVGNHQGTGGDHQLTLSSHLPSGITTNGKVDPLTWLESQHPRHPVIFSSENSGVMDTAHPELIDAYGRTVDSTRRQSSSYSPEPFPSPEPTMASDSTHKPARAELHSHNFNVGKPMNVSHPDEFEYGGDDIAKSLDKIRAEAREAMMCLWHLGVGLEDYTQEGIDLSVVRAQLQILNLVGPLRSDKVFVEDRPDVQELPIPSFASANKKSSETHSSTFAHARMNQTTELTSEERKDRIARLLAKKTKKTGHTVSAKPAGQTKQPDVLEKANKEKLLRQKMEALQKSRQARGVKAVDLRSVVPPPADLSSTTSVNHLGPTTTKTLNVNSLTAQDESSLQSILPSEDITKAPDAVETSIPGLFISSTSHNQSSPQSPAMQHVNPRKRPVAADFVIQDADKRPFGHTRPHQKLVIDVSDDEYDEGEVEENDIPAHVRTTGSSQTLSNFAISATSDLSLAPRPVGFAHFPPLSDTPQRKVQTPPVISQDASSTPTFRPTKASNNSLQTMESQLEELKKKIALAELKKKVKKSLASSQPLTPSRTNEVEIIDVDATIALDKPGKAEVAYQIDQLVTQDAPEDVTPAGEPLDRSTKPTVSLPPADKLRQLRDSLPQRPIPKTVSKETSVSVSGESKLETLKRLREEFARVEAVAKQASAQQKRLSARILALEGKHSQGTESLTPTSPLEPNVSSTTDPPREQEVRGNDVAMDESIDLPSDHQMDLDSSSSTSKTSSVSGGRDMEKLEDGRNIEARAPPVISDTKAGHTIQHMNLRTQDLGAVTTINTVNVVEVPVNDHHEAEQNLPGDYELVNETVPTIDHNRKVVEISCAPDPSQLAPDSPETTSVTSAQATGSGEDEDVAMDMSDHSDDEMTSSMTQVAPILEEPASVAKFTEPIDVPSPRPRQINHTQLDDTTDHNPIHGLTPPASSTTLVQTSAAGADPNEQPHSRHVPFESPFQRFHAFRFHPTFGATVSGGFKSLTYSNKIDWQVEVCPFETAGGTCNDPKCEFQHFKDMVLSEDKILVELGSIECYTAEQRPRFVTGLRSLLVGLRKSSLPAKFEVIAAQIAAYRSEFLGKDQSIMFPNSAI